MKRILYTSPFIPPEWIAAHGFQPCRIVAGASRADQLPAAPQGICHYVWRYLHDVSRDSGASAAVFTTICDQMRRAPEWLRESCSMPAFLFHVPKTRQSANSGELYRHELVRLGSFLCGLGGNPPSMESLRGEMLAYDAKRGALLQLNGSLPSRSSLEVLLRFYETGIVEIPQAAPPKRETRIPLALIGGSLSRDQFSLFDEIESAGGIVVFDGTENGERTFPRLFDIRHLDMNPVEELARAYFGSIPDIFYRPNDTFFGWLVRKVAASNVRGVIHIRNVWCDLWHAEVQRIREALPVPVLDLDVDGETATTRNRTRIQAFIESLQ